MSDENTSLSVDDAVKSILGTASEETDKEGSEENETLPKEDNSEEDQTTLDENSEDNQINVVERQEELAEQSENEEYEDTLVELEDGTQIQLEELLQAHRDKKSQQADYTRKTQAVAEQRKQAEKAIEEANLKLQDIGSKAAELDALMEHLLGEEQKEATNLAELAVEDPSEYIRKIALRDAQKAKRDEAKAKVEEVQKALKEQQENQYKEMIQKEHEALLTKVPEWQDESKRKADISNISSTLSKQYGFDINEFANIADHRIWLLLKDVAKVKSVEDAKEATLKKVKKAPKVLKAKGAKPKSEIKADNIEKLTKKVRASTGRSAVQNAAQLLRAKGIV
jgi:hypothetical protein